MGIPTTAGETSSADLETAATPALRLERIVSKLSAIRDPQARLSWLVEEARKRAPLEMLHRTDANRIAGCMVRSWWIAKVENGRCRFLTDSDAVTLKAILGLIADSCTGGTPHEIAALNFDFLDSSGVLRQLAENRQATIRKIAASVKDFAIAAR